MEWYDVDGNSLNIGDKVTCVTPWEYRPAPDTRGVVLELCPQGVIGVSWDGFTRGHSLSGCRDSSGWYCPPNTVRFTIAPQNLDVEKLKEFIAAEPITSYLIEGGRAATITYLPTNDPVSSFLTERDNDARKVLAAAMDSLEKLRAKLVEENKRILAMPSITREDVQNGMSLYIHEYSLAWLVPFRYAPKFISKDGFLYEIPVELQYTLSRDCLLEVRYDNHGIHTILLSDNIDEYERIIHYHSTDISDCLGDYRGRACDNAQNVWKVRDEIEQLFELINGGSLGCFHPDGIPSFETLLQASHKIEELPHQWVSPLQRGVKVKVIGQPPDFPTECIGSICKVLYVYPAEVTVRFRFENPSFFCYNRLRRRCLATLPTSNLEVVPYSTPCTQFCGRPISQA